MQKPITKLVGNGDHHTDEKYSIRKQVITKRYQLVQYKYTQYRTNEIKMNWGGGY